MNSQDSNPENAALSKVLRQWQVTEPLPPRFQEQVWRRIENAESALPIWKLLLRRLAAGLSRPAVAASYVSVLLLLGVAGGYWHARETRAEVDQQLSSRYVQMVAAYDKLHR